MNSSNIDPLAWISAERQIVTNFAATNAAAVSDLGGIIADFKNELQLETQNELNFTNDLASLTGAVNPLTIAKTIQDLNDADTSLDTIFSQLQNVILQNNVSAANLVSQVNDQAPGIQTIDQTRVAIGNKISNYKNALNTFRTYTASTTSASVSTSSNSV